MDWRGVDYCNVLSAVWTHSNAEWAYLDFWVNCSFKDHQDKFNMFKFSQFCFNTILPLNHKHLDWNCVVVNKWMVELYPNNSFSFNWEYVDYRILKESVP